MCVPTPRRAARAVALGLLALTSGCGGGEGEGEGAPRRPPPPRAPDQAPARAPASAPDPAERPDPPARVFGRRYAPLGPWWDSMVRRVDPTAPEDPWLTEVVACLARRVLHQGLSRAMEGDAGGFEPVLGGRFRPTTELRPSALETAHEDDALVLRRGQPGPLPADLPGGPQALGPLVSDLVAPYREASDPRAEVWITAAWHDGPNLLRTRGSVRLTGSTPEGGELQANLELEAVWQRGPRRVQLAELSALTFEELTYRRRPFEELTAHLLGQASEDAGWIWDDALVRAHRTDHVVVFNDVYLGMHGMAVGDLDGDGLEDVYVARHGGAPNRLLRHLPDGRVQDVAPQAGVDFLDDTCGVLIADLNGDGARDLALAVGPDVVLAWNDGSGRFPATTRLTREAKDQIYTLSAADADGDGDLDLYDTRYFSGSYGGDGIPTPYHDARNGAANSFWRGDGQGGFEEATAAVGLDDANDRFSLSSLWEDVDGDGDLDLYVVNDFGRNNLYRNDGGRFQDVAGELGLGDVAAGMGVTCRDVDRDGDLDLYISNMFSPSGRRVTAHSKFMPGAPLDVKRAYARHTRGNTLLANRGDGIFVDVTEKGMVGPGGWAWGAVFTDFENDGRPDMVVPNGFVSERDPRDLASFFWRVVVNASPPRWPPSPVYRQGWIALTRLTQELGYSWNGHERNYAYRNLGGGVFADVSAAAGLDLADDGRVACVVDWDGDGRLDLWLKNRTAPLVRFLHDVHPAPGNWIAFELRGKAPNTEAIGARVVVEAGGLRTARRVYAGEGYLGGGSRRLHFGLDRALEAERVEVEWPDGTRSEVAGLAAGALYRLDQGGGPPAPAPPGAGGAADLEGAPVRSLAVRHAPPDGRVVALERFPYSGLPLPRFDGTAERVRDHAGRPLVVYCWGSWEGGGAAGLGRLGEAALAFDLVPLSLDGPRDEAYARALAASSGLEVIGGRADRRTRALVEIGMQAVLGAYDDLPLPLAMVFDPVGRLCAIHLGEVDPGRVAADTRALAQPRERDGGRFTTVLTGGRWIDEGPKRPRLEQVVDYLRRDRGERALADEIAAFAAARE